MNPQPQIRKTFSTTIVVEHSPLSIVFEAEGADAVRGVHDYSMSIDLHYSVHPTGSLNDVVKLIETLFPDKFSPFCKLEILVEDSVLTVRIKSYPQESQFGELPMF